MPLYLVCEIRSRIEEFRGDDDAAEYERRNPKVVVLPLEPGGESRTARRSKLYGN